MAEDESSQPGSQNPVASDDLVGQPTETVAADSPVRIPKQIGRFHVKPVSASASFAIDLPELLFCRSSCTTLLNCSLTSGDHASVRD